MNCFFSLPALVAVNKNSVSGKANQEKLALQLYNKMVKFLEQEGMPRASYFLDFYFTLDFLRTELHFHVPLAA